MKYVFRIPDEVILPEDIPKLGVDEEDEYNTVRRIKELEREVSEVLFTFGISAFNRY